MEAAIAAGETVVTWNIPVTPGTNQSNVIMAAQKAAAQAAKAATQKYGAGVGIRLGCGCPIRQILKNRIRLVSFLFLNFTNKYAGDWTES
jgi:ABC-type sugar transport system substrate-binding protein